MFIHTIVRDTLRVAHRYLLGVDPSLTCSGWALFNVSSERLIAVGKMRSLPPKLPLPKRLVDLQERIEQLLKSLDLGNADIMVAEAPTTMRDPRAAFKVEQVRTIFETLGRKRGLLVPGRLNPRSIHHELLGLRGKQRPRAEVKEMAVQVVSRLFCDGLQALSFSPTAENLRKHQDIVDALLLGYLGMTRVRSALQTGSAVIDQFKSRADRNWTI